jgi:hypothetical protein
VGVGVLRKFLLIVFGLGFLAIYVAFLIQVVQAGNGQPPKFNDAIVGLAATISGAIGAAFAVALGVKDPASPTVSIFSMSQNTLLQIGLWLYALVGIAAA